MLVDNIFLALFTLGIGLYLILNGLRFFKYGKLGFSTYPQFSEDMYGGLAAFEIIGGTVFILLYLIIIFIEYNLLEIAVYLSLLLIEIYVFYWYWHTKNDPFAFDKVWEDPRDKKKKEPK